MIFFFFFFSSRRRHTRLVSDWSSDVCSSDLIPAGRGSAAVAVGRDAHDVIGRVGIIPRYAGGDLRHLFSLERWLAALLVCYLQGGENFPLAHATAAHGSGKAGQDVVALSRRYTPPDRASWFLRTLPRQEPHQPLRRIGELRLIRREDPLVGLAVWAGGRRRHNVTSGGLHVETRRHLDAGPHVVFRVLKVEVHATARSACHRRSRVAVFLQL